MLLLLVVNISVDEFSPYITIYPLGSINVVYAVTFNVES